MALRKFKKSLELSDISSLYVTIKEITECDAINITLSAKSDAR